ncbi:MAG: ATPase, T2SS/T4P/T4SS family [Candidatus Kerfeldbacteria bacterium]
METADQLAIRKMLSEIDTYKATDVHLSVGNPPMMRVGGKLMPMPEQSVLTPDFMERVILEWLDDEDRERLYEQKEIIVTKTFENGKRFRISVFYQQNHLSASLTLIPDLIPTLQELGLPQAAQQLVNVPMGLVLVIGPYGARQGTTVAGFVEYLNQSAQKHIVTIEDPVEILFNDNQCVIDQREVGKDVRSVAEGLDFVLAEDVDIVMVTDLSEPEAMSKALQVANTGKTVFGILNANSMVAALNLIINSFDPAYQSHARAELASSLAGIINQRVITSLTGDKVMIAEVLVPNDAVRSVIQKGDIASLENFMQTSRGQDGVLPLDDALMQAVQQGLIRKQEAARFSNNPEQFM